MNLKLALETLIAKVTAAILETIIVMQINIPALDQEE